MNIYDFTITTRKGEALNLADEVMVIELTPNRSDCLGMINMAREAAAAGGL